jgi:hypothetical protein
MTEMGDSHLRRNTIRKHAKVVPDDNAQSCFEDIDDLKRQQKMGLGLCQCWGACEFRMDAQEISESLHLFDRSNRGLFLTPRALLCPGKPRPWQVVIKVVKSS